MQAIAKLAFNTYYDGVLAPCMVPPVPSYNYCGNEVFTREEIPAKTEIAEA